MFQGGRSFKMGSDPKASRGSDPIWFPVRLNAFSFSISRVIILPQIFETRCPRKTVAFAATGGGGGKSELRRAGCFVTRRRVRRKTNGTESATENKHPPASRKQKPAVKVKRRRSHSLIDLGAWAQLTLFIQSDWMENGSGLRDHRPDGDKGRMVNPIRRKTE